MNYVFYFFSFFLDVSLIAFVIIAIRTSKGNAHTNMGKEKWNF